MKNKKPSSPRDRVVGQSLCISYQTLTPKASDKDTNKHTNRDSHTEKDIYPYYDHSHSEILRVFGLFGPVVVDELGPKPGSVGRST